MHGYVPAASIANNDSHAHTFLNIPEEVLVEANPAPRVEYVTSKVAHGRLRTAPASLRLAAVREVDPLTPSGLKATVRLNWRKEDLEH